MREQKNLNQEKRGGGEVRNKYSKNQQNRIESADPLPLPLRPALLRPAALGTREDKNLKRIHTIYCYDEIEQEKM